MKNRYLDNFDKMVLVSIIGSNVNNYLKRIMRKKIHIIKLIPVSYKEVHVILKYSDYMDLVKYKSIYKISIIKRMGSLSIIDNIKRNIVLILFIIIGIGIVFLLSNIVFDVEVIHQDRDIRNLLFNELSKYGLNKYTFKKSYDELEKIEDNILINNKERLEWIEIIAYGTKYIVRVEERKINKEENVFVNQNIVSKKDAVIVRIDAISGEKVKNVNDYVRAGDVVISGNVLLPDNTMVKKPAVGLVYGEVWYMVDISYPYVYQESNFTGKSKVLYVIKFFNKDISLFHYNKYKSFDVKNRVLVCSNFIDVCLIKQKQYEVNVLDEVYTEDIVRKKAIEYIGEKMVKDNADIKEIVNIRVLDSVSDSDSIRFKLFVRVVEDIGKSVLIEDN